MGNTEKEGWRGRGTRRWEAVRKRGRGRRECQKQGNGKERKWNREYITEAD